MENQKKDKIKDEIKEIKISTEYIKLDQFLKWTGVCDSGVDAKNIILDEEVKVNEEIETRRGKKLYPGDRVSVFGQEFLVK